VGGTSLTVFAAVHRLRTAFNLSREQLSDQTIYRFPTLRELAAYIDNVAAGHAPPATAPAPLLVTLKKGDDAALPPLFLIASAGGTLGAYEKLVKALKTRRDIIGVRDPFVWGDRDPTMTFQRWVGLYVDAIRERQPQGPYYLGAYSSAGALGYEVARQLRQAGSEVALLTLIDPLALDKETQRRFGYWAFRARFMRPSFERIVKLAGWLRAAAMRVGQATDIWSPPTIKNDQALTQPEFLALAAEARRSRGHIMVLSALLELNTGLPFALTDADLLQVEPDRYVEMLLERVRSLAPDVDPASIENIVVQYYLQTRAHHVYKLQQYDGTVALFEPDSPHKGLLAALLRPHVGALRVRYLKLGNPSPGARSVAEAFSARLRAHYLSMRDNEFVSELAGELDALLDGVAP
jgi:thioesterase domain-containing protein